MNSSDLKRRIFLQLAATWARIQETIQRLKNEITNKKTITLAVAAGCLIVGLTAGFIAGRNSSKVLVESEPYHMEAADYSIGVAKETDEGIDEPDETEPPISTSAPVTTPKPVESSTSGGTGSTGDAGSSTPSHESSIGTEPEKESGTDEDGGNAQPGGNTTYKDYINMSPEEKQTIAGQFSSPDEYFNWVDSLAQANADAEAEHTYSGSVNIDETFGNE